MPDQTQSNEEELRRLLSERGDQMSEDEARFIRAVLDEPDDEITHEQCRDLFPECIDAELQGESLAELFPAVKRHLDMCRECAEEYTRLMDLTRAELAGEFPIPEDVSAPDLSFLPGATRAPAPQPAAELFPLWVYAKQKAADVLAALKQDMTTFQTAADDFFSEFVSKALPLDRIPVPIRRGTGRPDETKMAITVSFAVIQTLIEENTPDGIDALATEGRLCEEIQESAEATVLDIGVEHTSGWRVASELAKQLCQDPERLKQLMRKP